MKSKTREEYDRIERVIDAKEYEHIDYTFEVGKINNPDLLKYYKFDEPDCEILLKDFSWSIPPEDKLFEKFMINETSLNPIYNKTYCLDDLKISVKHFSDQTSIKIYSKYLMRMEELFTELKYQFFLNMTNDEQKACILSLVYYTGNYSFEFNRDTNAVLRSNNSNIRIKKWKDKEKIYPIIYYLNKSLFNLPLYWGLVVRCVEMNEEVLDTYKPGNIISWVQYNSTCRGEAPKSDYFRKRNVWFFIYSLTGRDISNFSDYKESEKEVLLSPLSNFIVFKTEKKEDKVYIYLRQIELALSKKCILWVDDNIFNPDWENKLIIEQLQKTEFQIKIIPKHSTVTAMVFLKTMIKQIKKLKINIKIVTDMKRDNENPPYNAGANFINEMKLEQLNLFPVFIFTSDRQKAVEYLLEYGFESDYLRKKSISIGVLCNEVLDYLQNNKLQKNNSKCLIF